MAMLNNLRSLIPPTTRANIGRSIRNLRRKPDESQGQDFMAEVKSRLPSLNIKTIFGANIGLTALEYSDAFPSAEICAFEPSPANFQSMKSNLSGMPDIHGAIKLAWGRKVNCNSRPSSSFDG
jgi:hypothetical protein